jgi:hypothetical protein
MSAEIFPVLGTAEGLRCPLLARRLLQAPFLPLGYGPATKPPQGTHLHGAKCSTPAYNSASLPRLDGDCAELRAGVSYIMPATY